MTCVVCASPAAGSEPALCRVCQAWEDEAEDCQPASAAALHRALARLDYFAMRHQVRRR